MVLPLGEAAYGRAHRKIRRCLQANLVAVHLVAVPTLDILSWVDRITRVIGKVASRVLAINSVADRIVGVIRMRDIIAAYEAAGVGQIEIADLALDGERRLTPVVD